MLTKTFNITDLQRGLLFKNGSFEKVLTTGKHRFLSLTDHYTIRTYDITDTNGVVIDETLKQLLALYPERFNEHLNVIETDVDHIALVYRDDQLINVLIENQTVAYWKGVNSPRVELINIKENNELSENIGKGLLGLSQNAKRLGKELLGLNLQRSVVTLKVKHNQKMLLTRNKQFERIAGKGNYYFWNHEDGLVGEIFNTTQLNINERIDLIDLAQENPEATQEHMTFCETEINEIALVYQRGVLVDYVPPARKGIYWNGQRPITVKKQAAESGQPVTAKLLEQLENNNNSAVYEKIFDEISIENIQEQQVGFLYVNGKLIEKVGSGQHVWWNFDSNLEVKTIDLRLQNMEVNGQEILTKDRVNLRINLLADWKITEPETVLRELSDFYMHLYRELQLALRTVVSTKTLDELLDDKNLLNQDVMAIVADKVKVFGLELQTVGVKDIILPGEMREILGQVVEAQKMAEANLIKRREETQATRSLHNTAKVMEGNPTLLRLKELEVLEKITSQVGTLNVYGGLEGVMNNMIRLPKEAPKTVEKQP